ncbi:uncharacterized protein BX663DRAFT_522670 [Cokeromyces recurvatus]|uniref:uncharacterized protein n=1 Tax=Cokeromyces recurvatus TaxID=90255 RepID=UPI00221F2973|nr:uncharacterized protein BX663DRAFT_522670 [Cokeromyces recurvatus]KAI7898963.1 hypothetical protein BX663DRAFT_522670 [Cokeromyces recurvatus]
MTSPDIVYAIHDFEATNDDEVNLQYGEPIVILEKDDKYLDGWWHGRNMQGETGLFPMNYTSSEKPIPNHRLSSYGDESFQHRMSSGTSSASSSSDNFCVNTQQEIPTDTNNEVFGVSNPDPFYWNVEDVVTWLESVGLEVVVDNFIDQEITGDVLLDLDHEALKELGITAYGRRYKVINAINNLKSSMSQQTILNNRHSTNSFVLGRYASLTDNYLNKTNTISSLKTTVSSSAAPKSVHPANLGHKDSFYRSSLSPRVTTGSDHFDGLLNSKRSTIDASSMSHSILSDTRTPSRPASTIISNNILHPQQQQQDTTAQQSFPEFEGWLYKQSDRYKTWNKRWFVLYGNNLFYFKNPRDSKMKGIIHLHGYRVILEVSSSSNSSSSSININNNNMNKKCYFKLHHDFERTFFFYTTPSEIKQWIQVLMKATIKRDLCVPVVSSSTVNTVSLEVAQKMKPRPPSALMYNSVNKAKEANKLYRETIKNDVVNNTLEEEELILEECLL